MLQLRCCRQHVSRRYHSKPRNLNTKWHAGTKLSLAAKGVLPRPVQALPP